MKKIYFRLSGNYKKESIANSAVFLQSRNRVRVNSCYFGNNDIITEIRIPDDFFKKHFSYEYKSGIYRTSLVNKDIHKFMKVYSFIKNDYITND